jgi:hypothetical protein
MTRKRDWDSQTYSPTVLKIEFLAVQGSRRRYRNRLAKSLRCVAAALRMFDQSFDLFRRRGTLQRDSECDVFERRPRAFQSELVRDVKGTTDIDLSFLDCNFVKMREPRNLSKESKRSAHKKIRKRGRRKIGSTAILWLIAFEAKSSDGAFQVNILDDVSHRAKRYVSSVCSCLHATAEFLVLQRHLR